jgi:hypothetical protein
MIQAAIQMYNHVNGQYRCGNSRFSRPQRKAAVTPVAWMITHSAMSVKAMRSFVTTAYGVDRATR